MRYLCLLLIGCIGCTSQTTDIDPDSGDSAEFGGTARFATTPIDATDAGEEPPISPPDSATDAGEEPPISPPDSSPDAGEEPSISPPDSSPDAGEEPSISPPDSATDAGEEPSISPPDSATDAGEEPPIGGCDISGSWSVRILTYSTWCFSTDAAIAFELTGKATDCRLSGEREFNLPNTGFGAFTGTMIYSLVFEFDSLSGTAEISGWIEGSAIGPCETSVTLKGERE